MKLLLAYRFSIQPYRGKIELFSPHIFNNITYRQIILNKTPI